MSGSADGGGGPGAGGKTARDEAAGPHRTQRRLKMSGSGKISDFGNSPEFLVVPISVIEAMRGATRVVSGPVRGGMSSARIPDWWLNSGPGNSGLATRGG